MVEEKEDRFTLFKQGDERIFRQYYEKYYHALCLWVVRIIKEETRMHDIVQEAFIVLCNNTMYFFFNHCIFETPFFFHLQILLYIFFLDPFTFQVVETAVTNHLIKKHFQV